MKATERKCVDVSIIVAAYNTERYIARCINSILRQQIKNYEIVVVDDCSTDQTYSILKIMSEKNEQIRLFRNSNNRGAGYTKNKALGLCKGKYICFVDSDDWILDGSLKQVYELAEETQCDDVFYESISVYEDENEEIINDNVDVKIFQIYNRGICLFEKLVDERQVTVSAAHHFFRRSILNNKILFSENAVIDDWKFTAMLFNALGKTVVLGNAYYVYFHRKHGNITNKATQVSLIREFCNCAIEIYNNFNESDETYKRIKKKCFLYMMIEIQNEIFSKKEGWEQQLNEIQEYISKNIEICNFFEKSRFLSQYGNVNMEILQKLNNKKKIYVYGAGRYGTDTMRIIEAYGIKVAAFIVSKKKNVWKKDVPIFSVDEVEGSEDSFFVVAVSDKYKKEIMDTLIRKGISNYGCLVY